ncbi:MAG: preprotein translocase subunit SecA [Candidatus Doudnabacteria bacterium]|nr:preprotein translocase subunit SecA [Candidatus Doudnabacteria bacterium]
MSFISKIFSFEKDPLVTYKKDLAEINALADEIKNLSQEQIQAEIKTYRDELAELKSEDKVFKKLAEIRNRVFALTREASHRSIAKSHYDVQVVGGLVLSEGKIAEMKTGEGKTLTATLPLVLHALAGRGAHLVTVNDYLARWHASLMGPIFHYLGLSVSSIQHEQSFRYDPTYQPEQEEIDRLESETQGLVMDVKHMRPITRREAYAADITYGTNNEYGFDYLRDNMVPSAERLVQRDLFFVIVDEVDSILIDEARTPLIISQPDTDPTDKYIEFAKIVDRLQEDTDYTTDEKHKSASLSDEGINKIEKILNVENIYDTSKGVTTLHHIEQALRAKTLFKRDRDYVVRDNEIIIVDEFTGRMMFGRRYSEGLHQAIEAKEGVKIQQESKTLATITFQNLFRLYSRLSGMTGTAKTEEEEFFKIYKLHVEQIPTNKPMVREDAPDVVYKTEEAKFKAIANEVKERNKVGQPILIGTVSIAKNEILAEHLKKAGVQFEILNAKNHEREANIIAQAGRFGAVTLATNIAGRGVDILLGGNPIDPEEAKRVQDAGGLYVLGTERHESRRIDNQLRGRSGRQGDNGRSQFFVSMEDDLMRLFGGERMKNMMTRLGLEDDQPIEASLVSRSIEQAQKKIEGLNFDTRKHVLEFDDVLNHQRTVIYKRRKRYLGVIGENEEALDVKEEVLGFIRNEISELVTFNTESIEDSQEALKTIFEQANTILPVTPEVQAKVVEASRNAASKEFAITDALTKAAEDYFAIKEQELGEKQYEQIIRYIALQTLDTLWMEHLDTMDHLRDSVRLRGYGQRDPLVEYKKEGFIMFQGLLKELNKQIASMVLKVTVQAPQEVQQATGNIVLSSSDGAQAASGDPDASSNNDVGRNDPCPCGSGKKYKKCELLNTPEHQQNLAKK